MAEVRTIARGLYFGEGPRWHEGRLWFSDFYDHAVKSMGPDGAVTIEHQLDDQPSGLGWLPDGRLLVVSMRELKVLRQEGARLVEHADLSGLARHLCNDMVVDGSGRAWVGNFGFDLDALMEQKGVEGLLAEHPTTNLVRVDPDGSVHLAAADMHFPNGSAITPDGATLIVAGSATSATRMKFSPGFSPKRSVWARKAPGSTLTPARFHKVTVVSTPPPK